VAEADMMDAADFLKNRSPHSEVAVKDLESGGATVATFKPQKEDSHWTSGHSVCRISADPDD
jgi:hypothetical protein